MNPPQKNQILYRCPKSIVAVMRKRRDLKRSPQHKYPCVVLLLRPAIGTRVLTLPDGTIEYMAKYDEIKAFLIATDPRFAEYLPRFMVNKPIARERYYACKNAKRLGLK